jgi:hypothetical protein
MRPMKNGFLAATATLALIVASGSAYAQAEKKIDAQDNVKTEGQSSGSGTQMKTQGGAKTETKPGANSGQMKTQGDVKTERDAQRPAQAEEPSQDRRSRTQAQEPSGDKPAQLSETQRTQIGTTVRKERNLRRVERSSINFTINVGTAVPRSMNLAPLPGSVLTLVPAYRGYLYIVVGDDLLIVHPRTYEIVAIIPA